VRAFRATVVANSSGATSGAEAGTGDHRLQAWVKRRCNSIVPWSFTEMTANDVGPSKP
jgi:hypothetical protein